MAEKLVCPICGQPTRVYMGNARKDRLCGTHADLLKEGKLQLVNGAYIPTDHTPAQATSAPAKKESTSDLTCLICGEPSNGKHFCPACYHKYKDRSVDIRITNCKDVQIVDEYGNKNKRTKDGHYVRSGAERTIADYFFDHHVRIMYERAIPYTKEDGEVDTLHPDFYLPDYDLYIEFNGLTNKAYLRKKNYVNQIYNQMGFQVEVLESKDVDDPEETLGRLLEKYKKK